MSTNGWDMTIKMKVYKRIINYGKEDWYRNEKWNEDIEKVFEEKLKRARRIYSKGQYIVIQAQCLVRSNNPKLQKIGLELMDRVFNDFPQDNKDTVYNSVRAAEDLGNYYSEIDDLQKATKYYLEVIENPHNAHGNLANSDVPLLYIDCVLKTDNTDEYDKALSLFIAFDIKELSFQSKYCLAGKVGAFLYDRLGNKSEVIGFAKLALESAQITEPMFKKYPNLGVVNATQEEIEKLIAISLNE